MTGLLVANRGEIAITTCRSPRGSAARSAWRMPAPSWKPWGRLFIAGAQLTVPLFSVVVRKAYGLGAQAMVGGCFHSPFFAVAWPTGEFGAMGLEGAVRPGFRRELETIEDEAERAACFSVKLQDLYDEGKALTVAEFMEIDDVIDPASTREWILRGLDTAAARLLAT